MTRSICIANVNRTIEPIYARYCDTFFAQLRGFTFHSHLSPTEGLVLVGKRDSRLDSSIHMLFVSFDLSIIWIDSEMNVVDKVFAKAWRPAYFSKAPAKFVLEVHPDRWNDFEIGDVLEFNDA